MVFFASSFLIFSFVFCTCLLGLSLQQYIDEFDLILIKDCPGNLEKYILTRVLKYE